MRPGESAQPSDRQPHEWRREVTLTDTAVDSTPFRIDVQAGRYPIVYVRGFAGTADARESAYYDTYYGYSESSVEQRDAAKGVWLQPIHFEGQVIRLLKEYGYVDAANGGLALAVRNAGGGASQNPTQSLWISRFYDQDVLQGRVRQIEEHAEDLYKLICEDIPAALKSLKPRPVDLGGEGDPDYKVILIAHSMGGLVCRCLIQNIMQKKRQDPMRWIHRFVTIATPHGGIELSAVPDFLEELAAGAGNVFGAAIFKEHRMREYLELPKPLIGDGPDIRSLDGKYSEGRCLCIIGSDHDDYTIAKKATGNHSDGLVKQDRAYIIGAYWANVHRSHSGRHGIVNSFETYENVRRFLFGDTRVKLWLENLRLLMAPPPSDINEFYDLEFSIAIRNTGVFLHQRKQVPCENAMRFDRHEFPLKHVHLHTGFLDAKLRPADSDFSHFVLEFKLSQHRVQNQFLFDTEYPERTVYSESMEVRLNVRDDSTQGSSVVQYRWLSETAALEDDESWHTSEPDKDRAYRFLLRKAQTIEGTLCVSAGRWPDAATTEATGIDAARA
jgi:pimeloyl-ACP methyl ester carboxylesterase